ETVRCRARKALPRRDWIPRGASILRLVSDHPRDQHARRISRMERKRWGRIRCRNGAGPESLKGLALILRAVKAVIRIGRVRVLALVLRIWIEPQFLTFIAEVAVVPLSDR